MKLKHVDLISQQIVKIAIVSPPAITRKDLGGGKNNTGLSANIMPQLIMGLE